MFPLGQRGRSLLFKGLQVHAMKQSVIIPVFEYVLDPLNGFLCRITLPKIHLLLIGEYPNGVRHKQVGKNGLGHGER